MVACLPTYLSVRHSFCSAEIGVCHRLQLRVMSSFISVKIKWKMSLETLKNSLNFISLSINYLPIKVESSILHLFFSWKCHSYSKSVNHHLPRLQVLWQVTAPPCSICNNYAVTTYSNKPDDSQRKHVIIDSSNYPACLKTIICASRMGSFHVVTHYAYASDSAWLLKTKA